MPMLYLYIQFITIIITRNKGVDHAVMTRLQHVEAGLVNEV